jgi:hypothetical protein
VAEPSPFGIPNFRRARIATQSVRLSRRIDHHAEQSLPCVPKYRNRVIFCADEKMNECYIVKPRAMSRFVHILQYLPDRQQCPLSLQIISRSNRSHLPCLCTILLLIQAPWRRVKQLCLAWTLVSLSGEDVSLFLY